jgi:transposase
MDEFPRVTMLEMDRSLTRILKSAQRVPVSVCRYGKPWVWIVSHETWLNTVRGASPVPDRHPLAALRAHLDARMQENAASLHALAGQQQGDADIAARLRALILQRVYGIESARFLQEQLRHNALFEGFVGLEQAEVGRPGFVGDLVRLSRHPDAWALIELLLARAPLERFVSELGLVHATHMEIATPCALREEAPEGGRRAEVRAA